MKTATDHIRVRSVLCILVCVLALPCLAADPNYVPGRSYFSPDTYIEYIAGNAPFILTAPHGGQLTPADIPDRTAGTMSTDRNTDALARSFAAAYHEKTGLYPHVVLCHLKRTKLDANREIVEAAQGDPQAEEAWRQWHAFIDTAMRLAANRGTLALYVDLHGHAHSIARLELGYNLRGSTLQLSDVELEAHKDRSSLRALAAASDLTFAELLRGPHSFGALMEERGFPSVPSPQNPHPDGKPYFSGGYNTRRHTSDPDLPVAGLQIECNFKGVRDTEENRAKAAAALADTVIAFLAQTAPHMPRQELAIGKEAP